MCGLGTVEEEPFLSRRFERWGHLEGREGKAKSSSYLPLANPPSRSARRVWPVIGTVEHKRILGDAELVEPVEQGAYHLVVIDHRVVVVRLPASSLAPTLGLGVRAEVHVGGVEPHEERCAGLLLAIDKAERRFEELVVDRFHTLLGQRPGVLDATVGPAVDYTPGAELLPEVGEVLGRWVVW